MTPTIDTIASTDMHGLASLVVAMLVCGLCLLGAVVATPAGRRVPSAWAMGALAWIAALREGWAGGGDGAAALGPAAAVATGCLLTCMVVQQLLPARVRAAIAFRRLRFALAAGTGLVVTIAAGPEAGLLGASVCMTSLWLVPALRVPDWRLRLWLSSTILALPFGAAGLLIATLPVGSMPPGWNVAIGLGWVLTLTGLVLGASQAHEHLAALKRAGRDELTGLNRRPALMAHLQELGLRDRQPLAVLLLDADHFKQVNDRYGHATGDAVLAALGRVISGGLRDADLAARWGGEEFCIVLPGADAGVAAQVARRLVEQAAVTPVETPTGASLRFTISAGYACGRADALESTLQRADRALYAAKADGRNRVVGAPDGPCDPQPDAPPRVSDPAELSSQRG